MGSTLALLCAMLLPTSDTAPLLLRVARYVTPATAWTEAQETVGAYRWWSNREILVLKYSESPKILDLGYKTLRPSGVRDSWFGTPISPSHRQVLQTKWVGRTIHWTVTDLVGTTELAHWSLASKVSRPMLDVDRPEQAPSAQWSTDGNFVYIIEYVPVNDDQRNNKVVVYKWDWSGNKPARKLPSSAAIAPRRSIQIVNNIAILTPWGGSDSEISRTHQTWDIDNPLQTLRSKQIKAPKGQCMLEFLPSPNGKEAAWVMGKPGARMFKDSNYPYQEVSLWVSDLDGKGMRNLGRLPFRTKNGSKQMDHYQHFGEVHWRPDGTAISFIYNRKFYLLSVTP